jgi:hypothetical protein
MSVKTIEVNGNKYPIRYDLNALIEFEDITGKSLLNGISEQEVQSIRVLRALAFVGLKSGHYFESQGKDKFPFTIEDVGSWFDVKDSSFLSEFQNSIPKREEGAEGEASKPGE